MTPVTGWGKRLHVVCPVCSVILTCGQGCRHIDVKHASSRYPRGRVVVAPDHAEEYALALERWKAQNGHA